MVDSAPRPKPPRFARIPYEILTDPRLNPTDIRIYAALSLHAIKTNLVWVSQRNLASLTHMDRRTIRKSLKKLASRGYLSSSVHRSKNRTIIQLNSPLFIDERMAREFGWGKTKKPALLQVVNRPQVGASRHPNLGASRHPE